MKISVNDKELFTLTDHQKQVIAHVIPDSMFEEDMKRRLHWVLLHKYEHTFEALKNEWIPKLQQAGITSVPLDNEALANLIFSQPNYKNRTQLEAEAN